MAERCAHPACKCDQETDDMVEKGGKRYCSEHCINEGMIELRCGCGHPDCQAATPDYQI